MPVRAADDVMPRPAELEPAVQFWIRVYSQIDTNSGFLHDDENLAVVYETLHFAPSSAAHERQKIVEASRDHYAEMLRHIAGVTGPLSPEEQRVRDLWGAQGTSERLLEAIDHIRFQLGQSDRFREGLRRSGAWQQHIADTLASMKRASVVSLTALVIVVMTACAPPAEDTERSAACKEAGNTRMCSVCVKTKS